MPDGLIFDIKRFSTDDGPGIRTTVFLKGCPLRCLWCASPESWLPSGQLAFYRNKCISCGRCVPACPTGAQELRDEERKILWEKCTHCGECPHVCPSTALQMIGYERSPEALYREVKKDRAYFINSGGGVTLSGGEPAGQPEFVESFLRLCKDGGIATALDTSGFFEWSSMERSIQLIDLFLYDLKHMDEQLHVKLTGVSNKLILDNLKELAAEGKKIIVRVPVIPGYNDSIANMRHCAQFLSANRVKRVDLLPFNVAAGSKYVHIGKSFRLEGTQPPSLESTNRIREEFESAGIEAWVRK